MSRIIRRGWSLVVLMVASLLVPSPAEGIPAFARKYRVSCVLCHQPFPRLSPFGAQFAANGFRLAPTEVPPDTVQVGDRLLRLQQSLPLAIRVDAYLAALSEKGEAVVTDLETPYNIKLLSGGQVADGVSYYLYFFLSERGEVAGLEDAYVHLTDIAGSGIDVIAGQFQVSDPLFKRELRLEYEDYAAYRMRLGDARADLTYDRGLMVMTSPRDGTDVVLELVNGSGLSAAESNRRYDQDRGKNVFARLSQDLGAFRIGGFGYWGRERSEGVLDDIGIWGVDGTVELAAGKAELNVQYLRRRDGNPFFLETCAAGDPRCDPSAPDPLEAVAEGVMSEVILAPSGGLGRWHLYALYNRVWSERPVLSVRLGEPAPTDLYESVSLGGSFLLHRNFRLVGELTRDLDLESSRFVLGMVTGF